MKHSDNELATTTCNFMYNIASRINHTGKNAISSFAEGDEQRMMLMGLKRFTKADNYTAKDARRRIAARLIDAEAYCY